MYDLVLVLVPERMLGGRARTAEEVEAEALRLFEPHVVDDETYDAEDEESYDLGEFDYEQSFLYDFYSTGRSLRAGHGGRLTGVPVRHEIFREEDGRGTEVFSVRDLPEDISFEALVTPEGVRYGAEELELCEGSPLWGYEKCLAVTFLAHF